MVEVQIVCLDKDHPDNSLRSWIETALYPLNLNNRVRQHSGHCLVQIDRRDPIGEILKACRDVSYAYLRMVAWEFGGGFLQGDRSGGVAQCVASVDGSPLKPTSIRSDKEERPNGRQALFGSREGLLVARVRRNGSVYEVNLCRHRLLHDDASDPQVLINDSFEEDDFEGWCDSTRNKFPLGVLKAAIEKSKCVKCAHCHYMIGDHDAGER